MSGDFNMTPKWKVGVNTYYDLKTSAIQQLTMFISREMHCWQLSINVTPVGSIDLLISPSAPNQAYSATCVSTEQEASTVVNFLVV